jgi:hypothetical protein
MKIRALLVIPRNSLERTREWLNKNKIGYSYDTNIIFANLSDIPEELEEIAEITDPVISINDEWFFKLPEDNFIGGPYDSEDQARRSFAGYISWSGEFVSNLEKLR